MNYVQTFIWLNGCFDTIDIIGANSENINKVWPVIKSHIKNCTHSPSDKTYPKIIKFIDDLKGYINFTSQFDDIGLDIWNNINGRLGETEFPNEPLLPNNFNIPVPRGINDSTNPRTPPYIYPSPIYPTYGPLPVQPTINPLDITLTNVKNSN